MNSRANVLKKIASLEIKKHECTKEKISSLDEMLIALKRKCACDSHNKLYKINLECRNEMLNMRKRIILDFIKSVKNDEVFEYEDVNNLFD